MLDTIQNELGELGIKESSELKTEKIRVKDGVHLYRVKNGDANGILKYFENKEHRREIENYMILNSLNIPTIKVLGGTKRSILLEDISKSKTYRLGIERDLKNTDVAKNLAQWYKKFNNAGTTYIKSIRHNLYREIDTIKKEKLEMFSEVFGDDSSNLWQKIIAKTDKIKNEYSKLEQTFNYNDFYWTNFIVKKDGSEAIMFDYNFMGVGTRYSDLRNVTSSLKEDAKEVFLKEYGSFDAKEKLVDDVVSVLVVLTYFIGKRTSNDIPPWLNEAVEIVNSGELEERLVRLRL